MKAVMRASPKRDLLCAPWRGRAAEANSPTLRLDESTVKAGSQKEKKENRKEGGRNGAMTNARWRRNKKENMSAKPGVKNQSVTSKQIKWC